MLPSPCSCNGPQFNSKLIQQGINKSACSLRCLFWCDLQDVAVEAAAGEDKVKRLLYYFIAFFGTGFLVALHVVLVDRGFSEMFERFI